MRSLREESVKAALALATERGWADVRMHMIADRLGVPLVELAREFRDLDAIANAWFAQVLERVLVESSQELDRRSPEERLLLVMGAWFEALEPYAAVSRDMLRLKLHPSHPHHWLPMIFDLSRLMHWFLDVARIEGTGLRRALQEIVITGIFLGALGRWAAAPKPDAERARRHLRHCLERTGPLFAGSAGKRPATA